MASLFDSPTEPMSEPQTTPVNPYLPEEHPYASGPPAGAKSLFGLDDEEMAAPQQARPSLFDTGADQYVKDGYVTQSPFEAGIDMGQAMLWEAGNQVLQSTGFTGTDAQKAAEEASAENYAAAARTPVEGLWEQVQMGFGTVAVALPALPVAAVSTPAAVATGVLLSSGMTLGDLAFKGKALDPDYEASASDYALAGALGTAELLPALKIFNTFKRAAPALNKSVMSGLTAKIPEVAMATAAGGVVEGVQDAATSLKAYQSTDTELTDEAVAAIVDDAILEATVGALIVGPIAGSVSGMKAIAEAAPDRTVVERDENGEIVDVQYDAPTEGATSEAGFWKDGVAIAFGNATDRINIRLQDNPIWSGVRRKFVQNENDRVQMASDPGAENVQAQDVLEKIKQGQVDEGVGVLYTPDRIGSTANADAANAALRLKAEGVREAPTSEIQTALDAMWKQDANVQRMAGDLTDFQARGETYVPFEPDAKAMNEGNFIEGAKQDLAAQGKTPEEIQGIIDNQVQPYLENLNKNGGRYIPANEGSTQIGELLTRKYQEMEAAGTAQARIKKAKNLNRTLRAEIGALARKDNALEQRRQLGALSDKFLLDYNRGAKDARSLYKKHAIRAGQRLAHVEHWGENNEEYFGAVGDVLQHEYENGRSVDADVLNKFIQLINTAQKLPTHRVSAQLQAAQVATRGIQNLLKLPLAIIPSIAETLFVMNKYGSYNTLSTFGKVAVMEAQRKLTGKKPPASYTELVDGLSMSLQEATSIVSDRMSGDIGTEQGPTTTRLQRFAEGTKVAENLMFKWGGLAPFTETLRITAAIQAEKSIIASIDGIKSGDPLQVQKGTRKLMEAGLEVNGALAWADNGMDFEAPYYKENIRGASLALAEDVVVHPSPLKKPIWHSDERLMLVSHLKSFATVFSNSTMRNWYQNLTRGTTAERAAFAAQLAPYLFSFVALQWGLAGLREWIRTGDTENWDERGFWGGTLQGATYLGGVGMAADTVHGTAYGRSFSDSVLGPSAAMGTDAVKVVGGAMENPEGFLDSTIKTLTKQLRGIPMGGMIEGMLNEAAGVE